MLLTSMVKMLKSILGGIPMIADDMMTFIKNDIIVFGFGVFVFIILTLWFIFRKCKMGNHAFRLCNISDYDDWFVRFLDGKLQ